VPTHKQVCACKLEPALPQNGSNPQHVVTPRADALFGQMIEIKLEVAGKFAGLDHQLAIPTRGDRHVGQEANGGGHNVAVVIVGVFADQVNASGSAEDPGLSSEGFFEVKGDSDLIDRLHLRRHARIPIQNGSWGSSTSSASAFTKAAPLMLG